MRSPVKHHELTAPRLRKRPEKVMPEGPVASAGTPNRGFEELRRP
ncbi:hypothetical protein [Streptomyces sp. NPDC059466]